MESLFRDVIEKNTKLKGAGTLNNDFFGRAVCVCNADGAVSEQEASLFCEVFADLMPQFNLTRNDLQRVCVVIGACDTTYRRSFDRNAAGLMWIYLQSVDAINGTVFASRYRELLLRMANMFAFAEGMRNEGKLLCVAQIEKALSQPIAATTVAAVLPQQRDVGKAENLLSGADDVSAIAGLGAELKRFAAELNDPIKRIAREFVVVEPSGKRTSFDTLQRLIEFDLFYLFTLFNYDNPQTAAYRGALWAILHFELGDHSAAQDINSAGLERLKAVLTQAADPDTFLARLKTTNIDGVVNPLRACQRSPETMTMPPTIQVVKKYDDICGTQNAQRLRETYQRLVELVARATGNRDDSNVVEKVAKVLFPNGGTTFLQQHDADKAGMVKSGSPEKVTVGEPTSAVKKSRGLEEITGLKSELLTSSANVGLLNNSRLSGARSILYYRKAAHPRGFSRPTPRKIRDPHLTRNPRPNPAESATQTQPAALLTAVSRKSRIVKYDYVRVSWSVSPQEQRSHTNSSLGDGCGTLESNTPTATARCTVASARCTCCALRRTVGSSWARHT